MLFGYFHNSRNKGCLGEWISYRQCRRDLELVKEQKISVSVRKLQKQILENQNGGLRLATVNLQLPTRQGD